MTIVRTMHEPVTRGTFLRSAAVLTGGAFGLGGMAVSAQAAGTGRAAGPPTEGGDLELPTSWSDSVFFEDMPRSDEQGVVASFTTLYHDGPMRSLSAGELHDVDGIYNLYDPYNRTAEETFTADVGSGVALDEGPAPIRFTGDLGTTHDAEATLVRTDSASNRGVLLHMKGTSDWSIEVPPETAIAWDRREDLRAPEKVTLAQSAELLQTAVAWGYGEEGENPTVTRNVVQWDDAQHFSGWADYRDAGGSGDHQWVATALPYAGGLSFLFGRMPES